MKRKGFTLIELIAVIVVLGIIMLIATPKVVSTINYSKEKTAEETILGFINTFDLMVSNGNIFKDGTYNLEKGSLCPKNSDCDTNTISIKAKNINKIIGVVEIKDNEIQFDNGSTTKSRFCIDKYKVIYYESGIKIEKLKSECNLSSL